MTRFTFIQPHNPSAEMYVNPLEIQRFAGRLFEKPNLATLVALIDLNVRSSRSADFAEIISKTDILCIATPAGSVASIRTFPLQEFSRAGGLLVFVGETVADGLTELFLREFRQANHPIFSFVGRTESEFESLAAQLVTGNGTIAELQNVHWIDKDGVYHQGKEPHLSLHARASKPYFPSEVINECRDRGIFVLLDGLTRGCEHHCNYCRLNNSLQTAGLVQDLTSSTARTMVELSSAMRRDVYVQFTDENFFGGRNPTERAARLARIRKLAQELRASGYPGMIGVDTRADTVIDLKEDSEQAKARSVAWQEMAAAGLRYAYLGIESLSKTQLKRYSKALDLRTIVPALHFLDELSLSYTVGLIVLDPLVSLEEIQSTVSFVEEHGLYGKVASLLKEMRVEIRNPYYRGLVKRGLQTEHSVDNFVFLNRDSVVYHDPRVAAVLPITRRVHGIFGENGYRHSDLSAMQAFRRYDAAGVLAQIPSLVGQMEVAIWKYLIANQQAPIEAKEVAVIAICHAALRTITAALNEDQRHHAVVEPQQEAIRRYYARVFDRIGHALSKLPAIAA